MYPIQSPKDAKDAAALFNMHKHKYSPTQQAKIKRHIKRKAKRVGATVNLADSGTDFGNNTTGAGQGQLHAQAGKTRSQPRPAHGRFGKKGATNGEQATPGANGDTDADAQQAAPNPEQYVTTIQNLLIGQSVALPGGDEKVKRLGSGYQLVKMDGSLNKVVKTVKEATDWAKSRIGGGNDSNQHAA